MSFDKRHFREWFGDFPNWRCPRCDVGSLTESKDARQVVEPIYSKDGKDHPAWEPAWISYRFSAKLLCSNPQCGECVFLTGAGSVDEDENGWGDVFKPEASFPPITPFPFHVTWPTPVITELELACAHLWNDPGAAANRLRTAVEALLDYLNVKKTTLATISGQVRKKRVKISLHDRIVSFKAKHEKAADLLLAVKWLGNVGSHSQMNKLNRNDFLDGLYIMQHVLTLLFDDTERRVAKLARSINKQKGPIPPRRRRFRIRQKH